MRSLLEALIRCFPADFRERFGPEMMEQVRTDYERARARGRMRAFVFTATVLADLVRGTLAERWSPTWAATSMRRRMTMRTTVADLKMDVAHALRSLRRSLGPTGLAAGTLAIALAAVVGMFSVVDAVILRPLPYGNPDRLLHIAGSAPGSDMPGEFGVSAEFYLQYREASLLENIGFWNAGTNTLRVGERSERVPMSTVTSSLLQTLGASPALGRLPTPGDDGEVAVISHRLWTTWFDADPGVIGRAYGIAGDVRTVIGVMGADFWFPSEGILLWIPEEIPPQGLDFTRYGSMVGRLVPGAAPEALSEELTPLARAIPERFGGSAGFRRLLELHRPIVRPLEEQLVGRGIERTLWLLLGSASILLMIACANVANLLLVRAERRQGDSAVKRALGVTRARLIRTHLLESLCIGLIGGALAIVLALIGVPILLRAAPSFQRVGEVQLSAATLWFAAGASLLAALVCGSVPAVHASAARLTRLRESGRGSSRRGRWGRDALIVTQTSLALVLLIASGLLVRSFRAFNRVDLGYETRDVFTFQFAPERPDLVDGPSWARFHLDFMERLAGLPDVESVGVVNNVPLDEPVNPLRVVRGSDPSDDPDPTLLSYTYAGGDYFRAMEIEVLRGRPFEHSDHLSEPGSVVISRSAATLLWPGEDPIGRRFRREDGDDWFTVAGVVEDVTQDDIEDVTPDAVGPPLVYFPLAGPTPTSWTVTSPGYVVKTPHARSIAPQVRDLVQEVAPGAPMYAIHTMEDLVARETRAVGFTMLTIGLASLLALLLGAIGLFGVLSYMVAGRTREIGIRMALGARAGSVRRMVVGRGVALVGIGVLVGAGIAASVTKVLGGLLFEVEPIDPLTFLVMGGVMVGAGLLASYLPARHASEVDPVEALRAT